MWEVYKRGKTYWYYVSGPHHYERKSTRSKDKSTAERIARERERELLDPTYSATPKESELTVSKALEKLVKERATKGRAAGTVAMYRSKGGHFVRIFGADTSIDRIDAKALDRFVDKRREEGASAHTISKELITIRGALKLALRHGEYKGNIGAVMPSHSANYVPRDRNLSLAEAEALFAQLEPHRAALVAFAIATGVRISELHRARREDIDLEEGVIKIRGTKTKKSRDSVPIVASTRPLVERALRDGDGKEGLLFSRWTSVIPTLARACKRAKIVRVTPNDLRRTCGSWLVQSGVEPHLAGRMLRHVDSTMVDRVYGQMSARDLGNLIDRRQAPPVAAEQPAPAVTSSQPETAAIAAEELVQTVYKDPQNPPDSLDLSDSESAQIAANSLFRRRESNPYSRNQNPNPPAETRRKTAEIGADVQTVYKSALEAIERAIASLAADAAISMDIDRCVQAAMRGDRKRFARWSTRAGRALGLIDANVELLPELLGAAS